jgi:hypothetical protein
MHALRRLNALWHPDAYHGWGYTRRYFEGWYLKIVSRDQRQALAFIPGISMDAAGASHAFVQVMDGTACQSQYHQFEAAEFQPTPGLFQLRLGASSFSADAMRIALPGIEGEIEFRDKTLWPKMLGAPGIMGWYSFVPFMECNHGIVSMHHGLQGGLDYKGQHLDFSGGKGYIEKDWGRSFPRGYVWMQSNHFDSHDRASLMASVAHIPWLGSHFIGFISGFWLDGRLFRFATYTGARKHLRIEADKLYLSFRNRRTELRIEARQAPGVALASPMSGAMTGKINESLQASLKVELLKDGRRIFEGTGHPAGLELCNAEAAGLGD